MSNLDCKNESKLEQHAASVPAISLGTSSRCARGDSPRLTPNRIFTSHLESIIKNKEKESPARNSPKSGAPEVKVEVKAETDAGDPADPTPLHLLEERQEPCGAECEDSSFGSVKEEIRIHLTTEVHLIPLPDEDNLTESVDDTLTGEDDGSNSIEDQCEPISPEPLPQGSPPRKEIEDLESSKRKRSKSSKKRKKKSEESPDVRRRRSRREARKHPRKSKSSKHCVETEEPAKLHSKPVKIKEDLDGSEYKVLEESAKSWIGSSSIRQSLKDSQGLLNQSWSSVSPHRHDDKSSSSHRSHTSPLSSDPYSSSSFSTPVKTEKSTSAHTAQLRNSHPVSKIYSYENHVDVSSEYDYEVQDLQRELETPSAMSSRSGSGSSKPSTSLDFIPFCPPRPAYLPRREDLCHSAYMTGSPYAQSWQYPYYHEQHTGTPPPVMRQGVFDWQSHCDNPIAALMMYPPPPHPPRALNLPVPLTPPGTASDYPSRRYSASATEEHDQPSTNRLSLPSNLPGCTESPSGPPPVLAALSVDRRFTCLQNLHTPPRPNIFGYQLIGDSMLVRFAQQILGQPPIIQESLRFLGYCVSGQRIGDLLKRLKSGFYHLNDKVVLMIGTNDLVKNSQAEQMIYELRRVIEHLCSKAEKVVVLTLPPIPRFEHFTHHWIRLNKYNDYIRSLTNADMGVSVFDISPQYLLSKEELEEEDLLAEFNSDAPFCRGCLTCMEEEEEEFSDSSWSDEDEIILETDLYPSILISSSPVSHIDICQLYCNKRISKCRMDCFELKFSESSNRKDLIHLNRKGLLLVKDALYKLV